MSRIIPLAWQTRVYAYRNNKERKRVEMADRPEPIIGIDLGTTYSVVAVLDADGRPVTIPNRDGDLSTPSVVLFDDDHIIVGKEAQRLAVLEPDRVAECFKRDMGSPYFHRKVAGRKVPPQMLSAAILKRLKADAERRVGPHQACRDHRAGILRSLSARSHHRGGPVGRVGGHRHPQ